MQVTYYNDSDCHMSVYVKDMQHYVGYIAPNSAVSFEMDIPTGHGLFFKTYPQRTMLLVGTTELQTPVKEVGPSRTPFERWTDEDYMGGVE